MIGKILTIVIYILWFGFLLLPIIVVPLLLWFWKKDKDKEPIKLSAPSDDSVEEMKNIFDAIQIRENESGGLLPKEHQKTLKNLRYSDDILNLVRYAHFAGFNLTIEQDGGNNNPADFKTDLRRAAVEHRNNERKRYL